MIVLQNAHIKTLANTKKSNSGAREIDSPLTADIQKVAVT
jgi:hypothetical protein